MNFFRRQRLLWENYVDRADHDLDCVDAALFEASRALTTAKSGLLVRIGVRGTIDYERSVARLRNRLDSGSAYSQAGSSTTAAAAAMEPDVLELMDRRNRLAQEKGYAGYGHLAAWSERLDYRNVVDFVEGLRDSVIREASQIAREEDLTIDAWFAGIDRVSGSATVDTLTASEELVKALGLERFASELTWVIEDQPIFGVAGVVSVPDDVRILLRPRSSQAGLATAFHELGHALSHIGNRGSGIELTWDAVTDESMASIVESAGIRLLFGRQARERQQRVDILEQARMATSFLFEVAVNTEPSRAQQLYRDYYEPLAPVTSAESWVADTFRSVDPFHVHSYLIGARAADSTISHLVETYSMDTASWGEWMAGNLFVDGRRRTIIDNLDDAGVGLEWRLRTLKPD